jgi:hypothetical protein
MTLPILSDGDELPASVYNEIRTRLGGGEGVVSQFVDTGDPNTSYYVMADGSIQLLATMTDWGLAVTTAVAALPAGGGKIVVPRGAYTCVTPPTIAKARVAIVGAGPGTVVHKGANGAIMTVSGDYFRMRDLDFNGQSATYSGGGLNITGIQPSLIDVVVTATRDVCADFPTGATSLEVIGGRYSPTDVSVYSIPGIRLGNTTEISSPRIIGVTSSGQLTIEMVKVDNGTIIGCDGVQVKWASTTKKIRFLGNRVANGVEGAMVVEGTDHTVVGNIFAQGGLTLGASSRDCHVGFNRTAGPTINNGLENVVLSDSEDGQFKLLTAARFVAAVVMEATLTGTNANFSGAVTVAAALTASASLTVAQQVTLQKTGAAPSTPTLAADGLKLVYRKETFVDLGTAPQTLMGGESFSSSVADFGIQTPATDTALFTVYAAVDAGVQHKFTVVGGANCNIVESAEGVFEISGLGDGRTYTLTFTTGGAVASIKADAATVGNTIVFYHLRKLS